MRSVGLLLAVLAGAAFAAQSDLGHIGPVGSTGTPGHFPGTDDVITSQPFDYANLTNGLGVAGASGWMLADDITPISDLPIGSVELWMIYGTAQAATIRFEVFADNSGSPTGAYLYQNDCTNLVHTNTGLYSWGYALWYTLATIDESAMYSPVGGTTVWFALQTYNNSGYDYWLARNQYWAAMSYWSQDNGGSWISSQAEWGTAYEQFFILNSGVGALQSDTWAGIKAGL